MRRRNRYVFATERNKKHHFFRNLLLTLLILVALVAMVNFIFSNQVGYQRQKVTISDLPADLESWSILAFSDLQGQEFGGHQSIIAGKLQNVRVSSVVFAGDMLGKDGDPQALLDLAALIPPETPKLFLPGDEDPSYLRIDGADVASPLTDWAQQLVDAGITILDEPVLFTRGSKQQARIWFVPEYLYSLDLDSYVLSFRKRADELNAKTSLNAEEKALLRTANYQLARVERIRESISQMKSTDIQIAVTHVPLTQEYVRDMQTYTAKDVIFSLRNVSLVIAGHLCGGQVRLPGLGALYVPGYGQFPDDRQIMGLSYLSNIPQYISPGLGAGKTHPIPFRFMNPPAFTYIQLTSKMQ